MPGLSSRRPFLALAALLAAAVAGIPFAGPSEAQIVPTKPAPPPGVPVFPIRIDMSRGPWGPGSLICGSEDRNGWFGWTGGMVREVQRRSSQDPWLCDFIEGHDATFVVAVEPDTGLYEVRMSAGDPEMARGPIRVSVGDTIVADSVSSKAGESQTVVFRLRPRDGQLAFRVQSLGCSGFAVQGLVISGPDPAWLDRLYSERPDYPPIPDPARLPRLKAQDKLKLLKTFCDYLVENAPRDGCFSYHGAWYQNAYPARTLLAGARLLKEPRYAEKAFECLDRFVSRQGSDASWFSSYFGPAACDGATPIDSTTANLADIGTMTLCLAAAAPQADPGRRERYIQAARAYADSISLPNQMAEGAFPNRLWGGLDYSHPYTIATATQCASLAALFLVTGERRYLKAAENGARWIAWGTILDDGRLVLHPHDQENLVVKESTDFGDLFYIAEGLLWVRRATDDPDLRQQIDATLDRWLLGEKGAQKQTVNGYWWPPMDVWSSSKMAGMLYVLADHPRRSTDPSLNTWLGRALAWMTDRDRAATIGVLAPPAGARGNFAMAATGFGGLGVAAAIDRDVLYPPPLNSGTVKN